MVFYICSSTGQGRTQVSDSIRTTAQPPRGAGRPSGCVRGPRGSSGGDSVVKIVGGPDVACGFAAAERPRVRGAAPRRARPEMVPQPSEKARFAPGNGAPIGLRGAPQDAPLPGVARTGAETGLAFAGAAHRPEMAPQRIEKTRFAPENGAPLDRRVYSGTDFGKEPRAAAGRARLIPNIVTRGRRSGRAAALCLHLGDQRVGNLEVGGDVLHVVIILEQADQAQDLFARLVVDRDRVLRSP